MVFFFFLSFLRRKRTKTHYKSHFVQPVLHSQTIRRHPPFSTVMNIHLGWIDWALKRYWQLVSQMRALNLEIKRRGETIKHRLFSRQSLQADWRSQRWRKMTCHAARWGEERDGDALHGLQYGKSSYYLWPLHSVIPPSPPALFWLALWWRGEPYFPSVFPYGRNNPQQIRFDIPRCLR